MPDHQAAVNSLAYSSGLIASGSRDTTIRLWDTETWKTVAVLKGHKAEIESVAFSPDGRTLTSCDKSGGIRLWSMQSHAQIHEFRSQGSACLSLCFSPKGDRFVTTHKNGTALVWDAQNAEP